jgi:hypothetical protein
MAHTVGEELICSFFRAFDAK